MQYTETTQDNVIAATFKSGDAAYGALAELKQLDANGVIDLHGASVVTRDESGRIVIHDAVEPEPVGLATGGIIGLLVGILAGPLGVVIGGSSGLMFGSLYDLDEAERTESVLAAFEESVVAGKETLLVELKEPGDHAAVDRLLTARPGTVVRRDVSDVEAEIAAAERVRREAAKDARNRLRDERVQRSRTQVEAKVAEMKEKLPGRHGDGSAAEQDGAAVASKA